jgi:hypothetical protein
MGAAAAASVVADSSTLRPAYEAIYQRIIDGWDDLSRTEPIAFDSEAYAPPASGGWVRLTIEMVATDQTTIAPVGSRRFRRQGLIFAQCFAPSDSGVGAAVDLADDVISIFEGTHFSGVNCYETVPRRIEPDGRWSGILAETRFDFDDRR